MLPTSAVPLSTGSARFVSAAESMTGCAGAVVSSVKLKSLVAWLPARSVARTRTAFAPSTAMKLSDQLTPPSML